MTKLLTIVINTRNDNYYDNNIERVSFCLNYNLINIVKLGEGNNIEFLIIDWGSKVPLNQVIRIYNKGKNLVNFIHVSERLANTNSKRYFSKFNAIKSGNLGLKRASGKFILHYASDQFLTYKNWSNLLIFLKKNLIHSNKIYFLPRKIINNNFLSTFPNFSELDHTLEQNSASNFNYRKPNFFVGGGYNFLAKKKFFIKVRGYNEYEKPLYSAADSDLHNRLMYYVDKEDLGSKSIFSYKLSPHNLNGESVRKSIKKNNLRKLPNNPGSLVPNNKNWGLSSYKLTKEKAKNTLDLNDLRTLTVFKKINTTSKTNNFKYLIKDFFCIAKISYFLNIRTNNSIFDIKVYFLIFNLKIHNFFQYGYDNNYLLSLIGKKLDWLALFSYDFYSLHTNKDINKRQIALSTYFQSFCRVGYYKPVFLDKKYDLKKITNNLQGDCERNLIQIIFNKVPDHFIKSFFLLLNKKYKKVGYLIFKNCDRKKIFNKRIMKNFNVLKLSKSNYFLINKNNRFAKNINVDKMINLKFFFIFFIFYPLAITFQLYRNLRINLNFRK